jgi:hypothetical protein
MLGAFEAFLMVISMNFHAFFSPKVRFMHLTFFRWGQMLKVSENLGAKMLNDGDA